MSMHDPIADLLTRMRNALRENFKTVDIPASRLKGEICRVLKEEGYILDYHMLADTGQGCLRVELKYTPDREPVIQGMKRVSKPSLRVFRKSNELQQVRSGLGVAIVTTSHGVMTEKKARAENAGGEVLCEVW